jgi:hypothetical protein
MKLPIFIENSKIPVWLSKLSPIDIYAISLGPFVISRGTFNTKTRIHETIHYKQWVELGFVGFLIMYPAFWVWNRLQGMSGPDAYFNIPFEIEAYDNQGDLGYIFNRKPYAWLTQKKESQNPKA